MACVMPGELLLQPFLTPTSHPFRPPPRKSYYGTATSTVHQDYRCRTLGSRCCIHNIYPTRTPLHSFHFPSIDLLLCVSPNSYSLNVRFVASTAPTAPLNGESIIDCQTTIAASYMTQEGGRIAEHNESRHSDAVTLSRAWVNQGVTRCVSVCPYTLLVY